MSRKELIVRLHYATDIKVFRLYCLDDETLIEMGKKYLNIDLKES